MRSSVLCEGVKMHKMFVTILNDTRKLPYLMRNLWLKWSWSVRFISDVKNFFKKSILDLETGIWF